MLILNTDTTMEILKQTLSKVYIKTFPVLAVVLLEMIWGRMTYVSSHLFYMAGRLQSPSNVLPSQFECLQSSCFEFLDIGIGMLSNRPI